MQFRENGSRVIGTVALARALTVIDDMELDLKLIPFSLRGSYLKIEQAESGRLRVASLRSYAMVKVGSNQRTRDFVEIALKRGNRELPYDWEARPWGLKLMFPKGSGRIVFHDVDTLGFEIEGAQLKLFPCRSMASMQRRSEKEMALHDFHAKCVQQLRAGRGTELQFWRAQTVSGETGPYADTPYCVGFTAKKKVVAAYRIRRYGERWEGDLPSVSSSWKRVSDEYCAWKSQMPKVPAKYEAAACKAWSLMWMNQVAPEGA